MFLVTTKVCEVILRARGNVLVGSGSMLRSLLLLYDVFNLTRFALGQYVISHGSNVCNTLYTHTYVYNSIIEYT